VRVHADIVIRCGRLSTSRQCTSVDAPPWPAGPPPRRRSCLPQRAHRIS
jgi:hypothetical protein